MGTPGLRGAVLRLVKAQEASWGRVSHALHANLALLAWMTHSELGLS